MVTVSGCDSEPRDPGVEAAHSRIISAVQARDAGALYDLSVPELTVRFEKVFQRWVAARDGLASGQDADRATLREGLALRHLEGVRSAREFFIALVDFQGVILEDGVHAGLAPESVRLTDATATLRTRSGETFGYRLVDGTWRSELALNALQMWPDIVRLEANLARAESHLSEAR
jgi:hypothetical protein